MFITFYCHDWCICTCMVIASVVFAQHSACFVLNLKDQKSSKRLRPIHPSQWVRQNTGVNQERLLNRSGHVRSSKTRYRKGNSPADGSQAPRPTAWKDTFVSFEWFVDIVVSPLPDCLQEYRTAQLTDTDCIQLIHLCHNSWPKHKCHVPENVQQYWSVRRELAPHEDLLLCGHWIAVSRSLQRRHCRRFAVDIKESPSAHCEPLPQFGGQVSNKNLKTSFCPECCKAAQAPRLTVCTAFHWTVLPVLLLV